jgi:DnaJ-class molecular chaperone
LLFLSSPPGCEATTNISQDSDDYYAILGVSKNASSQEIKATYRKLALTYHPDKVPDGEKEEAEEVFVRLNEAYDVLGDDKKKKIYDQYGKKGLDMSHRGMDPGAAGFGGFSGSGFSGSSFSGASFSFSGGSFSFNFNSRDGSGGGGGGGSSRTQERAEETEEMKQKRENRERVERKRKASRESYYRRQAEREAAAEASTS